MNIISPSQNQDLLYILYHETTHIFSYYESKKQLMDRHNDAFFFGEGLADYLAAAGESERT